MSSKPDSIRNAKDAAQQGDRHAPTSVSDDFGLWARELSMLRISDLFKTLPGLAGHWAQIQGQVNAGNHYFFQTTSSGGGFNDGGKTSTDGRDVIAYLADAIVGAALEAGLTFH